MSRTLSRIWGICGENPGADPAQEPAPVLSTPPCWILSSSLAHFPLSLRLPGVKYLGSHSLWGPVGRRRGISVPHPSPDGSVVEEGLQWRTGSWGGTVDWTTCPQGNLNGEFHWLLTGALGTWFRPEGSEGWVPWCRTHTQLCRLRVIL